jgi:hypothetical protein
VHKSLPSEYRYIQQVVDYAREDPQLRAYWLSLLEREYGAVIKGHERPATVAAYKAAIAEVEAMERKAPPEFCPQRDTKRFALLKSPERMAGAAGLEPVTFRHGKPKQTPLESA